MPGFDIEDKNASLGDPSAQTTTPLSQKQMQGAQQATVNRTQLPSATPGPDPQKAHPPGEQQQNGEQPKDAQGDQGKQAIPTGQIDPNTPILGGLQPEVDQILGINPTRNVDWFKLGAEAPVYVFAMGRHIYHAFWGAFLGDPGAITRAWNDTFNEDNAFHRLMEGHTGNSTMDAISNWQPPGHEWLQEHGITPKPPAVGSQAPIHNPTTDFMLSALPSTADPQNALLYGGAGARGAELAARFAEPTVAQAAFGSQSTGDAASTLAWGLPVAFLFGGKMPAPVERAVIQYVPGVSRLLDRMGTWKKLADSWKSDMQDPEKFLQMLLDSANPGSKKILAPGWRPDIEVHGAEQTLAASSEIWRQEETQRLLDQYGTLNPDELIPRMVAAGASEERIKYAHTFLLRRPYDLDQVTFAEAPVRDPRTAIPKLPTKELQDQAVKGWPWVVHAAQRAMKAPSGHGMSPAISRFRSLVGLERSTPVVVKKFVDHLLAMEGADAHNEELQAEVYKAVEGDLEAYNKLPPVQQYVADAKILFARGITAGERESGRREHYISNWWRRVSLIKDGEGYRTGGTAGQKNVLKTQPQPHRTRAARDIGLDKEHLVVTQKYPTVAAAKAARVRLQEMTADQILKGTPFHEMEQLPVSAYKEIAQIRASVAAEPEWASAEAKRFAEELHPALSTNTYDSFPRMISQIQAIHSWNAVNDLLAATDKDGASLAIEKPTTDDGVRHEQRNGYKSVDVAGFRQVMIKKSYADLLERAATIQRDHTRLGDVWGAGLKAWNTSRGKTTAEREAATIKAIGKEGMQLLTSLADIEGQAVATIMYSPRIHGMNLAARLGMLGMMDPKGAMQLLIHGLIPNAHVGEIAAVDDSVLAWDWGVIPPSSASGWSDRFAAVGGSLTGDLDLLRTPLVRDASNAGAAAKNSPMALRALGKAKDVLWGKQHELWDWNAQFGVWAFHVELKAALNSGRFAGEGEFERAATYAARRANSWMGHVAPEDQNANVHALFKTLLFAPNWWRTWAELLTGYYKNLGVGLDKNSITYMAMNEARTALAAVGFQQLTANALNLMLSGHTIYQNDPGNWGKIEITQPWAVAALNATLHLGLDPKTGRDAKGRKLAMENPLARQMTDTEQALGLLTSAPQPSERTVQSGLSSFAAGRVSPVADALGALANIDVYRTITTQNLSYMDPNNDHMRLPGTNAYDNLAALAQLTPFSYIAQQMQQTMLSGQDPTAPMPAPLGTHLPAAIAAVANQLPQDALRMMLVGMTGINAPYMRSSKTFGESPTDDQYKSVHEIQTQYETDMNGLSTSALSGQISPDLWVAGYRQLSTVHAAKMQAIYNHAPAYNDGPLGLTNSWEGLYDSPGVKVDGIVSPDRLRAAQRDWRANHSSADYAAVQSELRVNDHKYPMLSLYHKTLDAYDNWQIDYCNQNSVDIETLRSELSGYGQVYNDRVKARQYLTEHPDIQPFETAKKTEFESGNSSYGEAGLMYALFFNPTGARNYLNAAGETPQQVEQAVQGEQVPPAP